ncbi:MAG: translation initiation factor IF-6 [Candidatus Micrarchaeia archaeon]
MLKLAFYGNPYIGIFARANDEFALIPEDSQPKFEESLRERLKVDIVRTSIYDSSLIGLYCTMNNNGIITTHLAYNEELHRIRKETGLDIYVLKSKYTAVGNIMCCNDKGAVISKYIDTKTSKEIGEFLDVEVIRAKIAGYNTCGSACICTNKGFVVHNDVTDSEMDQLRDIFGVDGINSTVNFGFEFPMYGIIANSKGYVVSENTTGIEVMRIDQGLGFSRRRI